jgi:serine/threonine protein kinase
MDLIQSLRLQSRSSDTNPYTIDLHIKPGKGSFASVYSASKGNQASDNSVSQPNSSYALKVMTITSSKKSEMVRKEIQILRRLRNHSHRNVLQLEEAFYMEDPRTVVLATQPYAPLSLEKFFTKTLHYDREEWYEPHHLQPWPEIIRQCLEGLEFLHTQEPQILHLDLKSQNILLWKIQGPNGHVEIRPIIADFGISTDLPVEDSAQQGTLEYMSPEVLDGASQTIYSDIWALGCCFAQIFVLLYPGERSLVELREAIHNPDQRGFSKNLDKVNSMLYRSDGKNYSDKTLEIFVDFRKTISQMLHPGSNHLRPTTQVALAYHQELEAHLEVTKLNISGLIICLKFGPMKVSSRVDGPNLPSIGNLIIFCKRTSESQRSVISTGIWRALVLFLRPSTPRLVYLTMPKNEKTNVTHMEDDFPSTFSPKKSERQKIDSRQPQVQSPYFMQLSTDQESVNRTIQILWKAEDLDLAHLSWDSSLHVFKEISRLSRAWNNAASSSSRKTADRECGLEISYYVDIPSIISFSTIIICWIYMIGWGLGIVSGIIWFSVLVISFGTLLGDFRDGFKVIAFLLFVCFFIYLSNYLGSS